MPGRHHMRRFTRLTAAHSKKAANHLHMLALYFMFYNFVKHHIALRLSRDGRWYRDTPLGNV